MPLLQEVRETILLGREELASDVVEVHGFFLTTRNLLVVQFELMSRYLAGLYFGV